MQDRYAGDVGDFSKFALLRGLASDLSAKVGLIWYRYPDEGHNNDGRHIGYLADRRWAVCDEGLVAGLRGVIGARSVQALEGAGLLPEGTRYFSEYVHPDGQSGWNRAAWFRRALNAVGGCDVVFVDPDNGIAGPNHRPMSLAGGKHITLDEIGELATRHGCVGIYHHFDRSASHVEQMRRQIERLKSVSPTSVVTAIRYRRISPRAYFLVTRPGFSGQVDRVMDGLCAKPWDVHFERV